MKPYTKLLIVLAILTTLSICNRSKDKDTKSIQEKLESNQSVTYLNIPKGIR